MVEFTYQEDLGGITTRTNIDVWKLERQTDTRWAFTLAYVHHWRT